MERHGRARRTKRRSDRGWDPVSSASGLCGPGRALEGLHDTQKGRLVCCPGRSMRGCIRVCRVLHRLAEIWLASRSCPRGCPLHAGQGSLSRGGDRVRTGDLCFTTTSAACVSHAVSLQSCLPPSGWTLITATGEDGTSGDGCDIFRNEVTLGQDRDSKFEVWFLLNAHCVHIKSKKCKSKPSCAGGYL